MEPHDNWADFYDFVYENTYGAATYNAFTKTTIAAIRNILPMGSVIDYGAGTGRLAIPLKQHGYNVTAVEISAQMARVLEEKALALNLDIPIHACSISEFNGEPADLALCVFTVLSYNTTEDAIKAIISNIANNLKSKGYFFFDLPDAVFFNMGNLFNINRSNFRRTVDIIPTADNSLYTYSEVCSGVFNGNEFSYEDHFSLKQWDKNYINQILVNAGFSLLSKNYPQFASSGSSYFLYQKD